MDGRLCREKTTKRARTDRDSFRSRLWWNHLGSQQVRRRGKHKPAADDNPGADLSDEAAKGHGEEKFDEENCVAAAAAALKKLAREATEAAEVATLAAKTAAEVARAVMEETPNGIEGARMTSMARARAEAAAEEAVTARKYAEARTRGAAEAGKVRGATEGDALHCVPDDEDKATEEGKDRTEEVIEELDSQADAAEDNAGSAGDGITEPAEKEKGGLNLRPRKNQAEDREALRTGEIQESRSENRREKEKEKEGTKKKNEKRKKRKGGKRKEVAKEQKETT